MRSTICAPSTLSQPVRTTVVSERACGRRTRGSVEPRQVHALELLRASRTSRCLTLAAVEHQALEALVRDLLTELAVEHEVVQVLPHASSAMVARLFAIHETRTPGRVGPWGSPRARGLPRRRSHRRRGWGATARARAPRPRAPRVLAADGHGVEAAGAADASAQRDERACLEIQRLRRENSLIRFPSHAFAATDVPLREQVRAGASPRTRPPAPRRRPTRGTPPGSAGP